MRPDLYRSLLFLLALGLMSVTTACVDDSLEGNTNFIAPDDENQDNNGQQDDPNDNNADDNNGDDNNGGVNNGGNNGGNNDNQANNDSPPVMGDGELTTPPGHSGSLTDCGTLIETEAFQLLNADREREGLTPLQCEDDLLIVARLHCKDMHERDYFDHVNPDGEQPWDRMDRFGVQGWNLVGENIAAGQRTPSEVQAAWMNSPGHRANILTPEYTHVGVAYYRSEDGQIFWTQLFARF